MTRAKGAKYAKEEGERGILMKRTMINRIVLAAVLLLLACGVARVHNGAFVKSPEITTPLEKTKGTEKSRPELPTQKSYCSLLC